MSIRHYWLSTPRFTVWVAVNAEGQIVDTAPYLYRRWKGDFWTSLFEEARNRWGDAVRYARLSGSHTKEDPLG